MRVTKKMVATATLVEALQSTSYRTGTTDVVSVIDGKPVGTYQALADFPYNRFGQTPRQAASFTASLAHLISIDPSFITGLSEEATHYIDDHCVEEYKGLLREAAAFNNLELPDGLREEVAA